MATAWRRTPREEVPNALVGAARRVNLRRTTEVENLRDRPAAEWQKLAWRHYDAIGEIKFAFNYFASISSRVRLYAGFQATDEDVPAAINRVKDLSPDFVNAARHEMGKLSSGVGGQPNLIRALALNILVAGECFLVGSHGSWTIRSTSELEFEADGRIRLKLSRHERRNQGNYLPDDAFVARIWRTHPQYSDDPDSSLQGVSSACEELLLLARIIKVSGQSRLNAGILYVADELRFQRSVDPTGESATPEIDPFEEELTLALTEPIDGESPSEIVPMIVRGPRELSKDGIVPIDLSRGFDSTLLDRHEKTLDRVLSGIDIPRDIVQGLAEVRYSNARTISEDLLKAHIEPMMVLICEALTTVFLRPMLLDRGYPSDVVDRVHVWYDASEVVTRPDRSEDADAGYDRGEISGASWRRSHGFTEADAPTDEERALRVAMKSGVTPEVTLEFLRQLAPELVAEAERLTKAAGLPLPGAAEAHAPTQPDETPSAQRNSARGISTPGNVDPSRTDNPPEGEVNREPSAASSRETQLLSLMSQLAAQRRNDSEVSQRTRKLERTLDVERRLRESLSVHLDDVVSRSLEKAGARTVSKVRGDAEMKSLVADVPMEHVFAAIPEDRRGEFSLEDEKRLVQDSIEKARDSFTAMIRDAQESGWRSLGVLEQMQDKQEERLGLAWTFISAKLVELAVKWLRKPKTEGNYVDMALIRKATAIAGGASATRQRPQDSGRAVLSQDAITATGWEFSDRYRWVHGVSGSSFEPHANLDNKVFDSWAAEELATESPEEYPFVQFYFPGDHNGCRCDWLPEVVQQPVGANA